MLKVLKFVFNLRMKTILKSFIYYFQPILPIHNCTTKFAVKNSAVLKFNKISTQRSIQYTGREFYNEMPDKINSSFYQSHNTVHLYIE